MRAADVHRRVVKTLITNHLQIQLFNIPQISFCILSSANVQIYLIFALYFQKNCYHMIFCTGYNVSLPRWSGLVLRGKNRAHRGRGTRVTHPPQTTIWGY